MRGVRNNQLLIGKAPESGSTYLQIICCLVLILPVINSAPVQLATVTDTVQNLDTSKARSRGVILDVKVWLAECWGPQPTKQKSRGVRVHRHNITADMSFDGRPIIHPTEVTASVIIA
ncbi:hypothetical protein J6590_050756 [Homalodisca vitripennis]|nr:hypothetical protein J6590_050756 [Homalodisca vitripennis]